MAGLDALISSFMGQTNSATSAGSPSWQDELLETVNPEKQRRRNIARALQQASTTLASTPGDFLTGLAAASGQGANAYITGRDDSEQQRMRVQQLLQGVQQKDQDRRLDLLLDAIGVQRNLVSDQRQAEEGRARQSDRQSDRALRKAESEARQSYWNRRGTNGAGGTSELTKNQILTTKRAIRSELKSFESQLLESARLDESITPETIKGELEQRRMKLEEYYGIDLDQPAGSAPAAAPSPTVAQPQTNVTQFDLMTRPSQGSATAIREGATATNPQTGERIIYRNGQWQPL